MPEGRKRWAGDSKLEDAFASGARKGRGDAGKLRLRAYQEVFDRFLRVGIRRNLSSAPVSLCFPLELRFEARSGAIGGESVRLVSMVCSELRSASSSMGRKGATEIDDSPQEQRASPSSPGSSTPSRQTRYPWSFSRARERKLRSLSFAEGGAEQGDLFSRRATAVLFDEEAATNDDSRLGRLCA